MPIPFRAHCSNIRSAIGCFEISIKKPSNLVDQALSTPDRLINFVTPGYGDRNSHIVLFENCCLMEMLPAGCGLMADRGFKSIQTTLSTKQITLIRPPSLLSTEKPPKEKVLLADRSK